MKKGLLLFVILVAGLTALIIVVAPKSQKDKGQVPSTETFSLTSRGLRATTSSPVLPRPNVLSPGITMYDRIEDAPEWTIRYGQEFWRRTENKPGQPATSVEPGNINIG